MLDEAGQDDEAAFHYGARARVGSVSVAAARHAGPAVARQGRNDEAIAQFEQLLVLAPRNADYHVELAALLSAQGRLDEAIAHYRQALQLAPNHAAVHAGLDKLLGAQPATR